MLRNQLSLAVLATAFALLLGDADAEENDSGHQNRRSCSRQNPDRVQVSHRGGSYVYGNYRNRNHSWNNAGRNPYGHGTHGSSYYGA